MQHSIEFTIMFIFAIILIAGAATRFCAKYVKIPYTIAILLFGLLSGLFIKYFGGEAGVFGVFHLVKGSSVLSSDMIFFVFLPALIFESAFSLDVHLFRKNLGMILLFAVPVLLLATLLTACFVYFLTHSTWQWGWPIALVFGALISATDPVAVVAILREFGVSKRLATLIEGESLLNDGASIVIFSVFFALLTQDKSNVAFFDIFGQFLLVVFGGIAVGIVLSFFISFWIGRTFNDPLVEISLTLALAYFSMLIGEGILHVSGVMAVVVSGIWMGSYGKTRISPEVEHFLHQFWELLAYIANTIIFFLVGLVIATQIKEAHLKDFLLISMVYLGITFIRFLLIFSFRPFGKLVGRTLRAPDATVVFWGGLRGAVSLALALVVFQNKAVPVEIREQLLLLTAGVVLLTILINGSSTGLLLQKFGYNTPAPSKRIAVALGGLSVLKNVKHSLEDISDSKYLHAIRWSAVKDEIETTTSSLTKSLKKAQIELHNSDKTERGANVWTQALNIEREAYWEAFGKGTLNGRVVRILTHEIDLHLDKLAKKDLEAPKNRFPAKSKFRVWLGTLLRKSDFLRHYLGFLEFDYLALRYELNLGENYASQTVLERLETIKEEDQETIHQIKTTYHQWSLSSKESLEEMRQNFPEITHAIEVRLANRITLNLEREGYQNLLRQGVIDETNALTEMKSIEEKMKNLLFSSRSLSIPTTIELLREVPLFGLCSEETRKKLAESATDIVLSPGDYLFHEGDKGESLFLIVRGAVHILREENQNQVIINALGGGQIIGEMALLSGEPRNASIKAVTPVSLIKISKEFFDNLVEEHPDIREAIWEACSRKLFDNFLQQEKRFHFLSTIERKEWIKQSTGELLDSSISIPPNAEYLFILSGEIQGLESTYHSSTFVDLKEINTLVAKKPTRVLWLPKIPFSFYKL